MSRKKWQKRKLKIEVYALIQHRFQREILGKQNAIFQFKDVYLVSNSKILHQEWVFNYYYQIGIFNIYVSMRIFSETITFYALFCAQHQRVPSNLTQCHLLHFDWKDSSSVIELFIHARWVTLSREHRTQHVLHLVIINGQPKYRRFSYYLKINACTNLQETGRHHRRVVIPFNVRHYFWRILI